MKKWLAIGMTFVCMLVVLAGCTPARFSFDISGATRVELRRNTSETVVPVTDPQDIQTLTDEINALSFRQWKSSEGYYGWAYMINWYDAEDHLIESITFTSENVIHYNNYFYCSSAAVDLSSLFD